MTRTTPRWLRFIPPTLLTLANLACGVLGLLLAFNASGLEGTARTYAIGQIVLLMIAAAVADGLDGYVARRLGAVTSAGRWLDILADGVTFALLPAVAVLITVFQPAVVPGHTGSGVLAMSCVWFAVAGWARLIREALRKDPRRHRSYLGLPLPYTAMWLMGLVLLTSILYPAPPTPPNHHGVVYVMLSCWFMSLLLISKLRYPRPDVFLRWARRYLLAAVFAVICVTAVFSVLWGLLGGVAGLISSSYMTIAGAYFWLRLDKARKAYEQARYAGSDA
ncbi:MAG: CDP-alcohol phosphatidyltransferase family protein [Planctomycetota bacterium]